MRRDFDDTRIAGRSELLPPGMCYIPQIVSVLGTTTWETQTLSFQPLSSPAVETLALCSLHLSQYPFPIQGQQRCLEMVLALLHVFTQGQGGGICPVASVG